MALPQLNSAKYDVVIPSTGKTVTYRPYLVKEEKILMVAMESKDDNMILKAVKEILSACIFDDIDIDALTSFDMELLFIKLRSKSNLPIGLDESIHGKNELERFIAAGATDGASLKLIKTFKRKSYQNFTMAKLMITV